jgi:hypothetical protein
LRELQEKQSEEKGTGTKKHTVVQIGEEREREREEEKRNWKLSSSHWVHTEHTPQGIFYIIYMEQYK